MGSGAYRITPETVIVSGVGTILEARYLSRALSPALGFELGVSPMEGDAGTPPAGIVLRLDPTVTSGPEGYRLESNEAGVTITARHPAGILYGCQTLRQLLPVEILAESRVDGIEWLVPSVSIEDHPRFGWRGHLFDTCRHFFTVDEVKRAIDLLAFHKCNRFHWHLTEDQGWRIEIKRYPKLTEIGAWRTEKDGARYGGFYTQDEVRDVVAYAAERHVMVVPEIELPGHSTAALASYPELGCTGGPYVVLNDWGVIKDVYCAGRDETFTFLENVLEEVLALFPSQYIHIGGDECPKDRWKACPRCQARIAAEGLKDEHELQSYFIKRFDQWLAARGRRLIGWDEILEGGLAPGAIVQSWRGVEGGIEAANARHDVIMSPHTFCYLDYSYGVTSLEKTFSYEPVAKELGRGRARHVLGVEGNMWTEWVPTIAKYDFQTYPRMAAIAELGWSPTRGRKWEDFEARMEKHKKRLEMLGVKYGEGSDVSTEGTVRVAGWTPGQMREEEIDVEFDVGDSFAGTGEYDVLLWYTSGNAGIQGYSVRLMANGNQIARDTHPCWSGIDKREVVYRLKVDAPAHGAKLVVTLKSMNGTDSNGDILVRKVC